MLSRRLTIERRRTGKNFDSFGCTALMYAAISDVLAVELVKLLINHRADVNAKDRHVNSGDSGPNGLLYPFSDVLHRRVIEIVCYFDVWH
jgi:hypothetical protein